MPYRFERVGVLFPQDEGMIPVIVQPSFAFLFQQFEVDDASDFVLLFTGDVKLHDVVVAVQVLALAIVAEQPVARTKRDAAHDSKCH